MQQQQQQQQPKQQGTTVTRARSCGGLSLTAHRAASRSAVQSAVQLSQAWYQSGPQHQVRKLMDEHLGTETLGEYARGDAKAGLRLRLEGQVAVLGGTLRVLNDSVAAQAGRVDLMNKRMSEWNEQIRDESRQKFEDLELRVQNLLADNKRLFASMETSMARVQAHLCQRLTMEDRQHANRENAMFANMEARLDILEKSLWESPQTMPTNSFSGTIAMCERQQHAQQQQQRQQQQPQLQQLQQRLGAEEANHALALVRSMEKPLCETVAKIEGLASELGEVHTKLGAHDEQQ